jgi:hypothetical protein
MYADLHRELLRTPRAAALPLRYGDQHGGHVIVGGSGDADGQAAGADGVDDLGGRVTDKNDPTLRRIPDGGSPYTIRIIIYTYTHM